MTRISLLLLATAFTSFASEASPSDPGASADGSKEAVGVTCASIPLPADPIGPTVERRFSRNGQRFDMIAWRVPCLDGPNRQKQSSVLARLTPVQDERPFLCGDQLSIVQGGFVDNSFDLTTEPDERFGPEYCNDLVAPVTLELVPRTESTEEIDLDLAFTVDWDLGDNAQQFELFAFDLSAYVVLSNDAAVTGVFYDPATNGEGFNFNYGRVGLTVFFYGFRSEGGQLWLVSETLPGDLEYGQLFTLTMFEVPLGTFGAPDPDSLTAWGTLQLTFVDCNTASATLSGFDGTQSLDLVRLAGVDGLDCGS